jgi:hypothetical protein
LKFLWLFGWKTWQRADVIAAPIGVEAQTGTARWLPANHGALVFVMPPAHPGQLSI